MNGGEGLFWNHFLMSEEDPKFLCDGYRYDLHLTHKTYVYDALGDHFGIILAYDISARGSWEHVLRLHSDIYHGHPDDRGILPLLILGLKSDLGGSERAVTREEAETFANEQDCYFRECSSLTDEGVHRVFALFVEHAYAASIRCQGDSTAIKFWKERSRMEFRCAMDAIYPRSNRAGPQDD